MGLMTLDDFQEDLQSALGDRGITDGRLNRWINAGYYDLCGAVEFEVLTNSEKYDCTSSQSFVIAPANTLVIKLIRDMDNDLLLGWVPLVEYWRRSQGVTDEPTVWTRQEENVYLYPVPDGTYQLMFITIEPPAVLTGSDKTVLPEIWDQAVFLLAGHFALLALGEEQRAIVWLGRAVTYIQSRMTEQDLQVDAGGLGASLPATGMAALQRRLSGMGGGGGVGGA